MRSPHLTCAALAVCLSSAAAFAASVHTNDGLELVFSPTGALTTVNADGVALPAQAQQAQGGFFISEVTPSATPLPDDGSTRAGDALSGTATQSGPNEVTVTATSTTLGVTLTGVVTGGATMRITAHLENTRGGDRAFVLYFRVPVSATGWSWSDALGTSKTLAASDRAYDAFDWYQHYRTSTSASPVATLASVSKNAGLALALPPTAPSIYRLSYQAPYGFQVEWELGTAPDTLRFPNAANVEALLYRVDAKWPYRSALKRLYLAYPQLWTKRAKDGTWMYDDQALGTLASPEDFALRFAETYLWTSAYTQAHGIYTMKYTEPWNDHLETSPSGLATWAQDNSTNQAWSTMSKGEPREVTAQAALLSAVFGRDGDYAGYSDPANFTDAEGTHRYVLNPDWELPNFLNFTASATDVGTVLNRGKAVEEYELFRQWGAKPGATDVFDGLYFDSTNSSGAGWAGWHLFNFRREHFATTRAPLVFDPQSGKVALSQALSSVVSLEHLADILHERHGLVMANGMTDPFIFSTAAYCDFVSPGEQYDGTLSLLRGMRAALYDKPSSFLFNSAVTEAEFAHALLYAVFPGGAGQESNRTVYKKWAPLMLEVAGAGWEPLTYATSSDPGVLVERYGRLDKGTLKFVVHRESGSGAATLTLDKAALGAASGVTVSAQDRVGGAAVAVTDKGDTYEVAVNLPAETSQVLAFTVTGGTPTAPAGETLPAAPTPPSTDSDAGVTTTPPDAGTDCPADSICAADPTQPAAPTQPFTSAGGADAGTANPAQKNPKVLGKMGCNVHGGGGGRAAMAGLLGVVLLALAVRRRAPLAVSAERR